MSRALPMMMIMISCGLFLIMLLLSLGFMIWSIVKYCGAKKKLKEGVDEGIKAKVKNYKLALILSTVIFVALVLLVLTVVFVIMGMLVPISM